MDTHDTRRSAEHFLNLIKESHRGKFKVYIGMSAGVGKTYRMLQEAHQLLDAGVDVLFLYFPTRRAFSAGIFFFITCAKDILGECQSQSQRTVSRFSGK